MSSSVLAPIETEIDYPVTDGQPTAETDRQAIPLMYAVTALRDYFRNRDDVYVFRQPADLLRRGQHGSLGSWRRC